MEKYNILHSDRVIPIWIYDWTEEISNEIRRTTNFYEIDLLEFIRQNYNNGGGLIDIGANIGNHSLYFSEFLEHDNIYCFEPFKDNIELLNLNLGSNSKCKIFDIALSDKIGEAPLYNSRCENNGGFSLVQYDNSYKVLNSIQITTLDSFNLTNISMIKIDVESHELCVLHGARETLLDSKPILFVEDLHYGWPHMFPPNRYNSFFEEIGYKKIKTIGLMDLWVPNDK